MLSWLASGWSAIWRLLDGRLLQRVGTVSTVAGAIVFMTHAVISGLRDAGWLGLVGIALLAIGGVLLALTFIRSRQQRNASHTAKSESGPLLQVASHGMAGLLMQEQKRGRRLHTEVGEHDPPGRHDESLRLVRECNEWHDGVSTALAEDDDVPEVWRAEWRQDPEGYPDVSPVARDHFDAMALWIADRLRLLDWMLRQLVAKG